MNKKEKLKRLNYLSINRENLDESEKMEFKELENWLENLPVKMTNKEEERRINLTRKIVKNLDFSWLE